jgi:nicotinamide-nucleotide amidase
MKAETLAVGEELLAPGRVETNSVFLTGRLGDLGIPVVFRGVVGDDERMIADAISQALARADVVLVSGGLGPTADDRTRDAACRALGLTMKLDPALLDGLEKFFSRRGIQMPDVNRRQAMVPEGARVLPNRLGTAPGLYLATADSKSLVLLPGPPRELEPMFEETLVPLLKEKGGGDVYRTLKLWVAGLPESTVEQMIGSTYSAFENPMTTILGSAGQVEIRLTATGATSREADARNEELASKLRELLGEHVFSESEESLAEVVGALLVEKRLKIAVAESVTGGLILHRLTQVPGASRYLDMGFVTYSNESKKELLAVSGELLNEVGAVSEEVAIAMAVGARERARSDVGVAVTGIAGPSGGSAEKPVGLVYVGLSTERVARARRFSFPGDRRHIQHWTERTALNLVRLLLRGEL